MVPHTFTDNEAIAIFFLGILVSEIVRVLVGLVGMGIRYYFPDKDDK